jgi:hypothetical protein
VIGLTFALPNTGSRAKWRVASETHDRVSPKAKGDDCTGAGRRVANEN